MMPARLALYAFFALLKKECPLAEKTKSCRDCTDCFLNFQGLAARQHDISQLYRKAAGRCVIEGEMSDTGILSLNAENFNSYKRKIAQDLERGFGAVNAARLAITSAGRRPDTRYGIALDREYIRVVL
jgi:CRISPR-associated protein Csx14